MTLPPDVLVDTGLLVAFYDTADRHHDAVVEFFTVCTSRLITTVGCVAEVMWLLAASWQVQNEFLHHLARGVYVCESLIVDDFVRIAELTERYADLPGDFPDLALIAISERLNIAAIATLDKDFDIYCRYRKEFFNRVFRP